MPLSPTDDRISGDRPQDFGQRLKALRIAAFLTQEQLAERAGLSTRAVQNLETARTRLPHPANRERLIHALNVDAATARWLFPGLDLDTGGEPVPGPDADSPSPEIIGRDEIIARIIAILSDPATRLLTLTGPGGVGKTSLAGEIVRLWTLQGRGPAAIVPLVDLSTPDDILPSIAAALGVAVRDQPAPPLLARALATGSRLLVLDNLEHLLEGATDLAWLLEHAPGLTILATSREALHLNAERVVAIDPLDTESVDGPAVELFVRRAAQAAPGFAPGANETGAVLDLCRRLDGLPLAIELAAAQMQVLSPASLLALFEDVGLRALADGARDGPRRFATMDAAIGWSWQRLDPFDQRLLRCASVFSGGFTAEAAGIVLADAAGLDPAQARIDAIAAILRLLRAHLLRAQSPHPFDDAPRFVMLEPIRLFAAEHLRRAGEADTANAAHARWIDRRLLEIDAAMTGPHPAPWFDRTEREYPNARAALDWAIAAGRADLAGSLAGSISLVWQFRDYGDEAHRRIDRILALPGLSPDVEAMICFIGADVAYRAGDPARHHRLSERLLAVSRGLDLRIGIAGALLHLSLLAPDEPDRASAIAHIRAAQAAIAPDIDWRRPFLHGWAALRLGVELHRAGDLLAARDELERAAALHAGTDHRVALAGALGHLGLVLADLGYPRAAAQAIAADIPTAAALGDRWMVLHLGWWLLVVALPHASDAGALAACSSLLASLEAEALRRAGSLTDAELAAIAPFRHRLPPPPTSPLPLADATVQAMALISTLPERSTPPASRHVLPALF